MAIHLVVYDTEEQPSDKDIPLFLSMFPEFEGYVTRGYAEWDYIVHCGMFKGTRFHLKDESFDIDKLFLIMMSKPDTEEARAMRDDELAMRRYQAEIQDIVYQWMTAVGAVAWTSPGSQETRLIPFVIEGAPGRLAELVASVNRQRMRSV